MRKTKWEKIASAIEASIENGELNPGEGVPSERELVEKFKVSRMTAHKAMRDLQSRGMICRTRGRGSVVAGARTRTNGPVGLILQWGNIAMEAEYLRAFHEVLGADYRLMISVTDNDPQREAEHLRRMAAEASGILINPTADPQNLALFRETLESGTPVVCLDRVPYEGELEIDTVLSDNYGSTLAAIRTLLARGHKRIAYFTDHQMHVSSLRERYEAYVDAMKEVGVTDVRAYSRRFYLPTDHFSYSSYLQQYVYDALVAMLHLPEPPTAVFCLHASYMVRVLDACASLGLQVPGDIEVMSYCEQPPSAYGNGAYKVHRIVQRMQVIGRIAAERLLRRMGGENLPHEVIRVPADLCPGDDSRMPSEVAILRNGSGKLLPDKPSVEVG